MKRWRKIGIMFPLILFVSGCFDTPTENTQPTLASTDMLLRIAVNPRGIVMAVGDTQQLNVQAQNILGDSMPIDDSVPVTYTSANATRVTVSSTGLLRAVSVTQSATAQPAPVRIIVRWQHGAITRADSIYVIVTLPRTEPIVAISIQPSPYPLDSTWIGYGRSKIFEVKGKTASGDSVTNLYAFLYTERRRRFLSETAVPATRTVNTLGSPGVFWVYASASIYGVPFEDSVRFTQLDAAGDLLTNTFQLTLSPLGGITSSFGNGITAFFSPCATVPFQNRTTIPLTITFDDPSKTGVCVSGDKTGNITLLPVGTPGANTNRKFPTAGLYTWTVTRTDGVPMGTPPSGKILVRDHTYWDSVP